MTPPTLTSPRTASATPLPATTGRMPLMGTAAAASHAAHALPTRASAPPPKALTGIRILGTGSATPANIMTNDDFTRIVDTSDEWITSRTGIRSRRIATGETTLSLALDAARAAIAAASIDPARISLVLCASVTTEQVTPSLACYLQRDLGLREQILAFDINAACSGFIYGLITAQRLLGPHDIALVVGSEVLSNVTDFTDRNTCVLFGDGAGAAILEPAPLPFFWAAAARGGDDVLSIRRHIWMDGQAVFRFAADALSERVREVTEKAGCAIDEVDCFICHQANQRIIVNAARQLGVPLERFFMNLADYGNTSAASIPLALDEAVRAGQLKRGQRLVFAGFGGGLTSGAVYLEY